MLYHSMLKFIFNLYVLFGYSGSPGSYRGQQLPLRGRKAGRMEGGIRSASFIAGGYLDRFDGIRSDGSCAYNKLFHVRFGLNFTSKITSDSSLTPFDVQFSTNHCILSAFFWILNSHTSYTAHTVRANRFPHGKQYPNVFNHN